MSSHQRRRFLLLSLVSSLLLPGVFGFIPLKHHAPKIHVATGSRSSQLVPAVLSLRPLSTTALTMSSSGGGSSKGIVTAAGLLVIVILFVGGSILPMMDMGRAGGGVAPLANSVATRDQGSQQQQVVTNDKYRLSRAAIQEKLNTVPVFYVVKGNGEMGTDLYLSYNDAKDVAGSKIVKATTLDQVEYPLVLKRGRMRMAPPPSEIQKAEESLVGSDTTFTLIPSKQALADAAELKMDLSSSDFPLFVADRLAFASPNGGLQVPLFLEKRDCLTSYSRLRGTNLNLPETPNIRSTTLNDELFSMEKGTRPGMTQLSFYASADDVNKAIELMGQ